MGTLHAWESFGDGAAAALEAEEWSIGHLAGACGWSCFMGHVAGAEAET